MEPPALCEVARSRRRRRYLRGCFRVSSLHANPGNISVSLTGRDALHGA